VSDVRVGQGWDRHGLEEGEELVVGGVTIDAEVGTIGHSDGDVLIHAVIDALLGAVGLGDIGQHFPSSSDRWKDADSTEMLNRSVTEVEDLGWSVGNVDATVKLENVRLAEYRDRMEKTISKSFSNNAPVNVKFKTADGHGPVGDRNAIDAQAVLLLVDN
jgi:2-C-methyl-D-erythritol 2,4-cyclodiphosphate synthase